MENKKILGFLPFNDETAVGVDFKYKQEDEEILNFFKNKALKCQREHVSRCFELKESEGIVGYLALSLCSINARKLKNPKNIGLFERPAIRIGQLIIDETKRGQGYGKCAINFVISIVRMMKWYLPCRLLVVDALNEKAQTFYEKAGFQMMEDRTLVFDLAPMLKQ